MYIDRDADDAVRAMDRRPILNSTRPIQVSHAKDSRKTPEQMAAIASDKPVERSPVQSPVRRYSRSRSRSPYSRNGRNHSPARDNNDRYNTHSTNHDNAPPSNSTSNTNANNNKSGTDNNDIDKHAEIHTSNIIAPVLPAGDRTDLGPTTDIPRIISADIAVIDPRSPRKMLPVDANLMSPEPAMTRSQAAEAGVDTTNI